MPTNKRRRTRLSEGVIRDQRPAIDIETSALSNAGAVTADLEPFLLRGLPEGETLPDMAMFQVVLGTLVRRDSETMEAADEAHFKALSRVNHFQLVRDDFSGRLYPKLTEIRDTFDAAFGRDSCQRILGIGVNIPTETLRLRRLGDRVLQRLTASDFVLPPRLSEGVAVDTVKWVEELTPDVDGLRQTLERLSETRRESERTLKVKTEAVETYRNSYRRCTSMLETLYRVSGNDHLADKLRPPTPKSSTPERQPDSGAAEGSGDDAGAEPVAENGEAEEPVSEAEAAEPRARPDIPPAEARVDDAASEARPDTRSATD